MTAEEVLLNRMNVGWIKVRGLTVRAWHVTYRRWVTLKVRRHPASGRYTYSFRGTTIQRNRLMFIWKHRALPAGFVDHKDGDKFNDHPSNLQDQLPAESHRQGWERQTAIMLAEWTAWLEFMSGRDLSRA